MHQRRKLIEWSLFTPNRFVVASNDLRLYELKQNSQNDLNQNSNLGGNQNEVQNKTSAINLLSVNSEVQQVKCLTWSPNQQEGNVIAVGLLTGKVLLTTFSTVNYIGKEFVPKQSRSCNCLAWNPHYTNQLAAGLDKIRSDHSILVWDLEYSSASLQSNLPVSSVPNSIYSTVPSNTSQASQNTSNYFPFPSGHGVNVNHPYSTQTNSRFQPFDSPHIIPQSTDNSFHTSLIESAETFTKPLVELAMSEATMALSWLPSSPSCLAAGTSVKWLRIYDLRTSSSAASASLSTTNSTSNTTTLLSQSANLTTTSSTTTLTSLAGLPVIPLSPTTSSSSVSNTNPRGVVAHSKAVYGVRFDPFCPERFHTFSDDGIIKVWDLRKLTDPFYSISAGSKGLVQVEWCPTRSGILASISREEDVIKFWDIKDLRLSISSAIPSIITNNSSGGIMVTNANSLNSGGISGNPALTGQLLPGLSSTIMSTGPTPSSGSSLYGHTGGSQGVGGQPTGLDSTPDAPVTTRFINKPFRTHVCLEPVSSMSWGIATPLSTRLDGSSDHLHGGRRERNSGIESTGRTSNSIGVVAVGGGVGGGADGGSNRLLTINNSGLIEVVTLKEPIPLSVSPTGHFAFANAKKLIEHSPNPNDIYDISFQMHHLARQGYQMDIRKNKKIAKKFHTPECVALWRWMLNCKETLTQPKTAKFPGLNSILWSNKQAPGAAQPSTMSERTLLPHSSSTPDLSASTNPNSVQNNGNSGNPFNFNNTNSSNSNLTLNNTNSSSNLASLTNPGFSNSSNLSPVPSSNNLNAMAGTTNSNPGGLSVPVYASSQRRISMGLCGWNPNTIEETLTKLEKKGQFERAAALAIFNLLDIRRAIKSLTTSVSENSHIKIDETTDSNMRLVAMCLAGYADSARKGPSLPNTGPSLWKYTYTAVKEHLKNPYLRFCVDFLVADSKMYRALVEANQEVFLWDRIAFACRFLPDNDLMAYIEGLTQRVIVNGNLEGIVLTGLTMKGVELFEHYVDKTADIQTASLALSHVVPRKFRDARVQVWMESYRSLLDIWGLWHIRAELDNQRLVEPEPEPSQVYARCNFCQQSLALSMIAAGKNVTQNPYAVSRSAKSTKTKVSGCPSCNKPLPKCALCQLPLGCSIRKTEQGTNFDDWFTWCQTCKHGGHAGHLSEWFQVYSQCPVSDCDCRCVSL